MKIKCPHCRKETSWENNPYKPFCSVRCKLLDLGSWLDEKYRVVSEDEKSGLLSEEGQVSD